MSIRTDLPIPDPDMKTAIDLGPVLPLTAEVVAGHLVIGGVDMVELARREGTALYVMDQAHIEHQLNDYHDRMAEAFVGGSVFYAGKAFTGVAMCRLVEEAGCNLLCAGGGELAVALAAGFPASRISMHGNNKTEVEITEALEAGVGRLVIDSLEELHRIDRIAGSLGCVQPVLIRVKPGVVADTHEYLQVGAEDSKFGFGLSDDTACDAVREALSCTNIALMGIHVHIGSQIFAIDSFATTAMVMARFFADVRGRLGYMFEELDMGGGLGIAYQATDEPPSVADYVQLLKNSLESEFAVHELPLPRIAIEPGRSVVADAGVTLYTVGSVKVLPDIRTYVAVDGGMTDNIRTALYGARYEAIVANKADQPRSRVVTIAGKHCESGDIIDYNVPIQDVEPGDIICVFSTGAYNQTMSSNYNKQVRSAVIFVKNGVARTVIRRETYADLLACEIY
jgi:diaminopimelate decarboxylase